MNGLFFLLAIIAIVIGCVYDALIMAPIAYVFLCLSIVISFHKIAGRHE